ncbi:MAG: hypothetical protein QY314_01575 [Candidatus Dojkabacteria bacterium]|nr:MAG: hypothetical protein QY314_01575 [Candidatus Dojkabacteria bacterium]
MSKRVIFAIALFALFVVGIAAAGATGFYIAKTSQPELVATQNQDEEEVFADPEENILVAEEVLEEDDSIFASGSTIAPNCNAVSASTSFDTATLDSNFITRRFGRYEIANSQLRMIKDGDTLSNNGKRVILSKMPGVYAAGEFVGPFSMKATITRSFTSPTKLDPKYKKDRDIRTITGVRMRLVSSDSSEGNLAVILFQRPNGKYFAELSRYVGGQYKVLERVPLAEYIQGRMEEYEITINAERVRSVSDGKNVQISMVFKKGGPESRVESKIEFKSRKMSGTIKLAGVVYRSLWQLKETSAYLDSLSYSGCLANKLTHSGIEQLTDASGLLEEELGE